MIKTVIAGFVLFISQLIGYSYNTPPNVYYRPRPKIIAMKLYHNDTIAILWVDVNGDDKCDVAFLYEKEDDYFIEHRMACQMADSKDMILEPKI